MDSPIDDTEGKLGQGFMLVDLLEEVDIGPGDRPRLTYVSAKLDPKYKQELINLSILAYTQDPTQHLHTLAQAYLQNQYLSPLIHRPT